MKPGKLIVLVAVVVVAIAVGSFLPGWREKPSTGDQIVVTGIGIRPTTEGYELSVQAVEALKTSGSLSEQNENATAVYQAKGSSVSQALQAFLNEAGRSTYILHNRIFALELSSGSNRSIFDMLDYFTRNLEGRALVDLVVCREDPSLLLSIESGNDAIPAEYVSQLLQEGRDWGIAVQTRLLDVERASSGMYDLVLPIMEVADKTPRLDGTAVFRKGKYVGELSVSQTTGFAFAADRMDNCLYTIDGVTFRITASSTLLKITPQRDAFRYEFSITGKADIAEAPQKALTTAEKQDLLKKLQQAIEADTLSAVTALSNTYRADPLGLARQTAKAVDGITQEQAYDRLPRGDYAVSATIRLTESGFVN